MGRRWNDRGDRAADNEDWPDNGGRGVGGIASGSGGHRLKREKVGWVGQKGTAAREVERRKQDAEDGGGRPAPKVVGAPRVCRGAVGGRRGAEGGTFSVFPLLSCAPSCGLAQSGNCAGDGRLGRERPRRGANPSPDPRAAPRRLVPRLEEAPRAGRDGVGGVRPGLAERVSGAERRDAPGGERPGSAQPRVAEAEAAPRGRCGTRVAPSQLRAPPGLRTRRPLS